MEKTKNNSDIQREKMVQELMFRHMDKPFTEKEIAEMYIKAARAQERLSKEIADTKENPGVDALSIKTLLNKYNRAKIASVALVYFEIRVGSNHDKVEKEIRKLKKEAA